MPRNDTWRGRGGRSRQRLSRVPHGDVDVRRDFVVSLTPYGWGTNCLFFACSEATGAAGCACDNREPPATIVNSGKKRAVGAAVWRLRALAEKPPPNPLGRDRHRPAEETGRISPLTPWGAFCALEWGATPTCSAYRPPKSPGVFSTEAGRGDRCSPVMGSMTRVEPPGPGRRRHRD